MKSVNRITLLGNLTRDPELKTLNGDNKLCRFSVATSRSYKTTAGEEKEEVQFHNVVAWGKLGELVARFMVKGSPIYMEGRMVYRQYEDKTGVKKTAAEVVMEEFVVLRFNKDGEDAPASSEAAPDTDADWI